MTVCETKFTLMTGIVRFLSDTQCVKTRNRLQLWGLVAMCSFSSIFIYLISKLYIDSVISSSLPKMCMLVPLKNRLPELLTFLPYMTQFLRRKKGEVGKFEIIILQQIDEYRFNRASLINVGVTEIEGKGCDYIVMQDVDLLPANPILYYGYPEQRPYHVASPIYHPIYRYDEYVGAILSISLQHFGALNGMSNTFWGWGHEDDEFYHRLKRAGLIPDRPQGLTTDRNTTFIHLHNPKIRPRDRARPPGQLEAEERRNFDLGLSTVLYTIKQRHSINIDGAVGSVLSIGLLCNQTNTPCNTSYQSNILKKITKYLSDLIAMFYVIVPDASYIAKSPLLNYFRDVDSCLILTERDLQNQSIEFQENDVFHTYSESSLSIVLEKLKPGTKIRDAITNLKKKDRFRVALKELYPEFLFMTAKLKQLDSIDFQGLLAQSPTKSLIVKPNPGFFAIGVQKMTQTRCNPRDIQANIVDAVEKCEGSIGSEVISRDDVIIEECVEGLEFAVDLYYDKYGRPHIIAILAHPVSVNAEYVHVLYYTNKAVFERNYDKIMEILVTLNQKLKLTSITIHAEFMQKEDGRFFPIEFNPLRLAGCDLLDPLFYAIGINPIQVFFEEIEIDWSTVWNKFESQNSSNASFGAVICYRPKTGPPDDEKMKKFINPVAYYPKTADKLIFA